MLRNSGSTCTSTDRGERKEVLHSVYSRIRTAAFSVLLLVPVLAGCASVETPQTQQTHPGTTQADPPPPRPELPGGGRSLLPENRMIGMSGAPGSKALGPLTGDLDGADANLTKQAEAFHGERQQQPVYELIATRADSDPGDDHTYRSRSSDKTVDEYLAAARRHGAVLLLGIQPGRADFLDELRHYEPWLRQPDVGVALDPEWSVGPDEVPGETFGNVTGRELNEAADYLAGLVRSADLPQKPMIYHQLSEQIVRDEQDLQPHPELAMVKSVDGIGSPAAKRDTWKRLVRTKPDHVAAGFKVFYEEDTRSGPLMRPEEILALTPKPEYVLYE